jgi:hypothetical protein
MALVKWTNESVRVDRVKGERDWEANIIEVLCMNV